MQRAVEARPGDTPDVDRPVDDSDFIFNDDDRHHDAVINDDSRHHYGGDDHSRTVYDNCTVVHHEQHHHAEQHNDNHAEQHNDNHAEQHNDNCTEQHDINSPVLVDDDEQPDIDSPLLIDDNEQHQQHSCADSDALPSDKTCGLKQVGGTLVGACSITASANFTASNYLFTIAGVSFNPGGATLASGWSVGCGTLGSANNTQQAINVQATVGASATNTGTGQTVNATSQQILFSKPAGAC